MKTVKVLAISSLFVCIFSMIASAQKLKPEEVIAKHLESIGTAEKRDSIKSLIAVGDVNVKFVTQKNHPAEGRIVIASTGAKNFIGMNLNAVDYPLEKFSFDGDKAKVGFVRASTRSVLGNFVLSNGMMLEQSLLGGALTTSWVPVNPSDKKGKFTSEGSKKIDGKETYAIGFSVKGGGDLDITMYFDKANFRHVRTEYKRSSPAGIGTNPNQSAGFSETRYKLVEDFSDHKEVEGLTLPHTYKILYSVSGQNGTTEIEWTATLTEFGFNQTLEDSTFDAEK